MQACVYFVCQAKHTCRASAFVCFCMPYITAVCVRVCLWPHTHRALWVVTVWGLWQHAMRNSCTRMWTPAHVFERLVHLNIIFLKTHADILDVASRFWWFEWPGAFCKTCLRSVRCMVHRVKRIVVELCLEYNYLEISVGKTHNLRYYIISYSRERKKPNVILSKGKERFRE